MQILNGFNIKTFLRIASEIIKKISLFYLLIVIFLFSFLTFWSENDIAVKFEALLVFPFLLIIIALINNPGFRLPGNWGETAIQKGLFKGGKKRTSYFLIFLASAFGLFAELMIIRLHVYFFPLLGFYKNISLLSCFLGLGIGFLAKNRKDIKIGNIFLLLAIQLVFFDTLSALPVAKMMVNPVPDDFTMGLSAVSSAEELTYTYILIFLIYVFNALCFIFIGRLIALLMNKADPLKAYGMNILGSLAGIVTFTFLSYLWLPPSVWVIVAAVFFTMSTDYDPKTLIKTFFSLFLILFLFSIPIKVSRHELFSPYQNLEIENTPMGISISANQTYFQNMWDFRGPSELDDKITSEWRNIYDTPYFYNPEIKKILIVGSGTGNDVSSALRNTSAQIDAVEIDPVLVEIGIGYHPEKPYLNERVKVINDDARHYIRNTGEKYDLIIYGFLDSHTLLASKGGVRLDSYIYTTEALMEARQKLNPGGVINMTFAGGGNLWLERRLYRMFEEAFSGVAPKIFFRHRVINVFASEDFKDGYDLNLPKFVNVTESVSHPINEVVTSTDNWPFFYMESKKIPFMTLVLLIFIIVLSFKVFSWFERLTPANINITGFFLGAGFMLLETKAITEMAKYFGSTWMVVAITSFAALLLAFVANLIIRTKIKINLSLVYLAIAVSILTGLVIVSKDNFLANKYLIPVILTFPLFFSGIAFSEEIKIRKDVTNVLSWNLLGVILGGVSEYLSLPFGFHFLYYLAIFYYFAAYIFASKKAFIVN